MTDWSEERPTIELVKQTVTLPEVVEMLGIDIGSDDKIVPPWRPEERTGSCHIYGDHFYDYGSGRYGDLFDFLQETGAYEDVPLGRLVSIVWRRALRAGKEPGDVKPEPVRELQDFTTELQKYPELDWRPANAHDMRDPFGRRQSPGDGTVLVPHREPGLVYGVKTRGPNGKAAWTGSLFTHRLYDWEGWVQTGPSGFQRDVVICEGESDAWAMVQVTLGVVRVLALPSGAGSWKDHWLRDLNGYETVWLCMDNDRAGQAALDKLQAKIGYGRARPLKVPQLYGDAREAIEAGWKPAL